MKLISWRFNALKFNVISNIMILILSMLLLFFLAGFFSLRSASKAKLILCENLHITRFLASCVISCVKMIYYTMRFRHLSCGSKKELANFEPRNDAKCMHEIYAKLWNNNDSIIACLRAFAITKRDYDSKKNCIKKRKWENFTILSIIIHHPHELKAATGM